MLYRLIENLKPVVYFTEQVSIMKIAISKKNLWEKSPQILKTVIGKCISHIPMPYILGKEFRDNYKFIQNSEFWSAEQIESYQVEMLRKVCMIAYEKSPYYANIFNSAGFHPNDIVATKDIQKLPLIDKDVINNNLSEICTEPFARRHVDYISTGGTSGKPLSFYTTSRRSSIEYAYLLSGWGRIKYKLGMPKAVLRGNIVPPDSKDLFHQYDPLLKHHYYSSFHMSDNDMSKYIAHIKKIGKCYIHAYPSTVNNMAKFMLRENISAPKNVQGIIVESENIYEEQRKLVQDVFNCRYFSSYGHTEKLVAATECEHSENYHVWPTYGYFELIDKNGNNISTPGEVGEVVGTGFINTVTPFIRYKTGDYATYVNDRCELCGRNHIIIKDIRGHRLQESLIAKDHSFISWTAINMHDDTFDNVTQFQFYQKTPGKATLKIVPAEKFCEEDSARIRKNIALKVGGQLDFIIEIVDKVSLTSRGKAIYVDQKIDLNLLSTTQEINVA